MKDEYKVIESVSHCSVPGSIRLYEIEVDETGKDWKERSLPVVAMETRVVQIYEPGSGAKWPISDDNETLRKLGWEYCGQIVEHYPVVIDGGYLGAWDYDPVDGRGGVGWYKGWTLTDGYLSGVSPDVRDELLKTLERCRELDRIQDTVNTDVEDDCHVP